jgi:glucose-6-phosphate dehydrogenase assembly protein OpcA
MPAAVSADSIIANLDHLWVSFEEPGAAAESQAVLRACAMTLFVFAGESEDPAHIAEVVAEVMRDYPNRAVIVRVRESGEPLLDSQVTAQCWMPFGARQQICCEQVELTASDASLPGLMPILLAIAAPDLPRVVWCRSPRIFRLPAMAALFERADKVIIDTAGVEEARTALSGLRDRLRQGQHVMDLSWTRITRWREIVAEVFEDPARLGFIRALRRILVQHAGDRTPATAYYLAAWVIACAGIEDVEVRFEPVPAQGGGIEGIALLSDDHTVSVRRAEDVFALIEVDSLKGCTAVPRLTEAELLRSELAICCQDPVFERSVPIAARLAGR